MDEVDIDSWALEEFQRLQQFVLDWKFNARENPEQWPLRMPAGEFDEQYHADPDL